MSVKIEIPTPLREHTNGLALVEVSGVTVKEALDDLILQHPKIGAKLFNDGRLRPHINVFVNDEDIRYLDDMNTPVTPGQIIALIPAVAGG